MGIYIKDMEIPEEEQSVITINIYSDGVVTCYDDDVERKAVPVPPHGRLGDLDAVEAEIREKTNEQFCVNIVHSAPTIIPAEEDE